MKDNQNKILISIMFGLVIFFIGGYVLVVGVSSGVNAGERGNIIIGNEASVLSVVERYYQSREERIEKLIKKDLYGRPVEKDEYGIVEDAVSIDTNQLLQSSDWEIFSLGKNGLVFDYPNVDWFVQTENSKSGEFLIITTTESGDIEAEKPWAKITIGEYDRSEKESLLDWLENSEVMAENGNVFTLDKTIQYIKIGGSVFLGSIFFEEDFWVGKKSVYAEDERWREIFSATLEIKNMKPDSDKLGDFENVFYTILESLEVRL